MNRDIGSVEFTRSERARLADVCKCLGITFAEFAKHAVMMAVGEYEAIAAEERRYQCACGSDVARARRIGG